MWSGLGSRGSGEGAKAVTTKFTGLRPANARKTENPPAATPVYRFVMPLHLCRLHPRRLCLREPGRDLVHLHRLSVHVRWERECDVLRVVLSELNI